MKGRRHDLDVIVIGAGSAGFAAALAAAEVGASVALIEKGTLGGECPTVACIPTKSFLHAAKHGISWGKAQQHAGAVGAALTGNRLTSLLAAKHITHIKGNAVITGAHTVKVGMREWSATSIVMAQGAASAIPEIPGLQQAGFFTYKTLLTLKKPPASAVILGGGPVGVELAEILLGFGAQITIIESALQLLPQHEPEVSALVEQSFRERGAHIYTGAYATKVTGTKQAKTKTLLIHQGRMEFTVHAAAITVATGRPGTVKTDTYARVLGGSSASSASEHLFAAGDVVQGPHFTHVASYDGDIAGYNAAQYALGNKQRIARDHTVIPQTVFANPEVARVGLTEAQVLHMHLPYTVGHAMFAGFGRALTRGTGEGLVKVIAHAKTGVILGASIVGEAASELIHELALAIHMHATVQDVATMMHAYPTGAETIKAACLNAYAPTP